MQCKNCGRAVSDQFCSHCGQRADVARISVVYVLQEAFHFLTNIQHRFFATSWRLLRSPGIVVDEFIDGQRTKYQSPVSYFLVWIAIYVLILSLIDLSSGANRAIDYGQYFGPGKTTAYAIGHLGLVLAAIIPFQSLYMYLLISRSRFTYFENVVAVIFLLGTIILLQSGFVVLVWLLHWVGVGAVSIALSDILKVVYVTWFAADLSKRFAITMKPLRVVLFAVLAIGTFSLWRLYGVPALFRVLPFADV